VPLEQQRESDTRNAQRHDNRRQGKDDDGIEPVQHVAQGRIAVPSIPEDEADVGEDEAPRPLRSDRRAFSRDHMNQPSAVNTLHPRRDAADANCGSLAWHQSRDGADQPGSSKAWRGLDRDAPRALRILWGFVSPHHARFVNFVRPPGEMLANLRNTLLFRSPRYLGHNPAGAAMIIALIVMTSITCTTGYMIATSAYCGSKWVEEVHEAFANATVALIVLHVLGVLIVSFEHRGNLVKSMLTGKKRKID
jgi:cytochrome b